MRRHRLDQLPRDAQHRIQRRHRVLEDHRDLGATDLPKFVFGQRGDLAATEADGAGNDAGGFLQQVHNGLGGHALAGAGLTDNAKRLATVQREADAVHRAHHTGIGEEPGPQVADPQQRLGCVGHASFRGIEWGEARPGALPLDLIKGRCPLNPAPRAEPLEPFTWRGWTGGGTVPRRRCRTGHRRSCTAAAQSPLPSNHSKRMDCKGSAFAGGPGGKAPWRVQGRALALLHLTRSPRHVSVAAHAGRASRAGRRPRS